MAPGRIATSRLPSGDQRISCNPASSFLGCPPSGAGMIHVPNDGVASLFWRAVNAIADPSGEMSRAAKPPTDRSRSSEAVRFVVEPLSRNLTQTSETPRTSE